MYSLACCCRAFAQLQFRSCVEFILTCAYCSLLWRGCVLFAAGPVTSRVHTCSRSAHRCLSMPKNQHTVPTANSRSKIEIETSHGWFHKCNTNQRCEEQEEDTREQSVLIIFLLYTSTDSPYDLSVDIIIKSHDNRQRRPHHCNGKRSSIRFGLWHVIIRQN